MADFSPAFDRMIVNEGGYVLHEVANDRGGMTYSGIARNHWAGWPGWSSIDAGLRPEVQQVRDFYKANFWDVLRLDEVVEQSVAATLFDFGVNAGIGTAAKLAQLVVGMTPDGKIGQKSLESINACDPEKFVLRFTLAKLARYAQIVTRDKTQSRFLLGWVNRSLKGAAV